MIDWILDFLLGNLRNFGSTVLVMLNNQSERGNREQGTGNREQGTG
jgi:hypothetical protein